MTIRTHRWCLFGCGKKVIYKPLDYNTRSTDKSYVCENCGKRYTKKQLGVKENNYYIPTRKIPSIRQINKMVKRK